MPFKINPTTGLLDYYESAAVGSSLSGGNPNSVIYLNNSGNIAVNANFVFDGTNLGVGTPTPAAKFDVVGGNIRMDTAQALYWGDTNTRIEGNATANIITFIPGGNEVLRMGETTQAVLVTNPSASLKGLAVRMAENPTGNGLEVQNSNGAGLFVLTPDTATDEGGLAMYLYGRGGQDRGMYFDPGGANTPPKIGTVISSAFNLNDGAYFGTFAAENLANFTPTGIRFGRNTGNYSIDWSPHLADITTYKISLVGQSAYASATTNQNGGQITITGGIASSDTGKTGAGGDIIINGGAGSPSGTHGNVLLASSRGHVILGGGTTAGEFRFLEPSGSGSNYTAFKAQAQGGNITYTLPAAAPAGDGYSLVSTTGGVLSWADVSGGAIDHGVLTGLSDDDHTQYALLAGRSAGQTLKGGTGVTDILKLQGTSGNGTADQPAVQTIVGNNGGTVAMTVLNNGNVGIGSTAPDFKLQVAGHLGPETDNVYNLGSATKRFANVYANNLVAGSISASFTPGSVLFADSTGNINQDNASFFFDDTNNRLGVGTSAPSAKLHANSGTTNRVARFESTDPTAYIAFQDNNTNTGSDVGVGATGDNLIFLTSEAERARFTVGGNFGIGTTAPDQLFDVRGNIALGRRAQSAVDRYIGLTDTSGAEGNARGGMQINQSAGGNTSIIFHTGLWGSTDTDSLAITAAGRVGVGTTSPWAGHLEVIKNSTYTSETTAGLAINTGTDGQPEVLVGTDNTNSVAYIQSLSRNNSYTNIPLSLQPNGGNVGIGTTSPSAKLDVSSDIVRVRTAKTPASAGATGNQGDICWDADYVYVCTATNTWKRSALATW